MKTLRPYCSPTLVRSIGLARALADRWVLCGALPTESTHVVAVVSPDAGPVVPGHRVVRAWAPSAQAPGRGPWGPAEAGPDAGARTRAPRPVVAPFALRGPATRGGGVGALPISHAPGRLSRRDRRDARKRSRAAKRGAETRRQERGA